MRHTHLTFGGRLCATLIGGGASLVLVATTLAGTALAADQTTTNTTTPTQTTAAAAQTPEALGSHTRQLHGVVKTAPSAGATTFTLTTARFGDVTVSFAGSTLKGRGHARGRARSFELATAADLKAGDRLVVQGRTNADGKSFVARRVQVVAAKDAVSKATHLVGMISSVATASAGTTLTIKLADGTSQSVSVSSETKIRPEGKSVADISVGTRVTVVSKNGTATSVVVLPA